MKIHLIAKKLGHSFSPLIHSYLADYSYELTELEEESVSPFMKKREFDGLNVTIPYKQTVMPMLDFISEEAEKIGAVNTVLNKDGKLTGYNTDYYGFCYMMRESGISMKGKDVLIIGRGGASKTVQYAAARESASRVRILTREDNTPEKIAAFHDAQIIVNATPVGMYPHNGASPVNLYDFSRCEGVLDLIYNPYKPQILLDCEKRGIPGANGLGMLVAQAKKACEIFTGKSIDDGKIRFITNEIRCRTSNIILIGMPGCGKSTIGQALAQKLGRKFYDIDAEITNDGISPADIIRTQGEDAFRRIEHNKCSDICKQSGAVIATGGGVVTRAENRDVLRQNGIVIFIDRPLCDLATDNRPLSAGGGDALRKLYENRIDKYRSFCDAIIPNTGSIDEVINAAENAVRRIIDEDTCN